MAIGNVDVTDCVFLRASLIDRHYYFRQTSQDMMSLD